MSGRASDNFERIGPPRQFGGPRGKIGQQPGKKHAHGPHAKRPRPRHWAQLEALETAPVRLEEPREARDPGQCAVALWGAQRLLVQAGREALREEGDDGPETESEVA